jgi:hypothetical protein
MGNKSSAVPENMEIKDSFAPEDIELVNAAVQAHADGDIVLPTSDKKFASKFIDLDEIIERSGPVRYPPFSFESLVGYLGFGYCSWRITNALGNLRHIREGVTTRESYIGMNPSQGKEYLIAVNSTEIRSKKSELATKLKVGFYFL